MDRRHRNHNKRGKSRSGSLGLHHKARKTGPGSLLHSVHSFGTMAIGGISHSNQPTVRRGITFGSNKSSVSSPGTVQRRNLSSVPALRQESFLSVALSHSATDLRPVNDSTPQSSSVKRVVGLPALHSSSALLGAVIAGVTGGNQKLSLSTLKKAATSAGDVSSLLKMSTLGASLRVFGQGEGAESSSSDGGAGFRSKSSWGSGKRSFFADDSSYYDDSSQQSTLDHDLRAAERRGRDQEIQSGGGGNGGLGFGGIGNGFLLLLLAELLASLFGIFDLFSSLEGEEEAGAPRWGRNHNVIYLWLSSASQCARTLSKSINQRTASMLCPRHGHQQLLLTSPTVPAAA